MKFGFKIFFLALLIAVFGFLFFYFTQKNLDSSSGASQVCIKSYCFLVETARTDPEREKGLMFRQSLPEGHGMLFIFDKEGGYSFWMKNTLIPLDMVWMDKNKKVVYIAKNVQPCIADNCPAINPNVNAQYVLEANAGAVDKIGIETGDMAGVWYN